MTHGAGYREELVCPRCGYRTRTLPSLWRCPSCGYPLQLTSLREGTSRIQGPFYRMGEGESPLVVFRKAGSTTLVYSLEHLNPTGSFKDLGTSAVVGDMVAKGARRGVVDSSGNSAISFSYYMASAGLEAHVVVPRDAPKGKLGLIRASGAHVHLVDSREEASREAERLATRGYYYAGHTLNPHFIRGVASRFRRVIRGLDPCRGLTLLAPLSSGTLVLGAQYAARSLENELSCRPRVSIWGILPSCNLSTEYQEGVENIIRLDRGDGGCSMLDALRIGRPPRMYEVLEALRGGGLVVVDDSVVENAWRRALGMGFIVEPSSSVVVEAASRAGEFGWTRVLAVLTGSGLKYVDSLPGAGRGI